MRTTPRRAWQYIGAVLCALLPCPARAADTPSIKEVPVDLEAHTFVQVLPFDVPFFITGQAPPRTRQIRVTIQETLKDGSRASPTS